MADRVPNKPYDPRKKTGKGDKSGDRRNPKGKPGVGKKEYSTRKGTENRRVTNDPSFYTRNSALARDAGSFSFTWPIGSSVDLDTILDGYSTIVGNDIVPGVAVIMVAPGIGNANSAVDAPTIAARNVYSFVRHANSGHSNYDPPDLMLYLIAMDSIYSFYGWLTRIYGTLALASQRNKYYPESLIRSMGLDYENLLAHMSDLRFYINQLAVKIGSFCVPDSFTLMARHFMLFSTVYIENAEDPKAQSYIMIPEWFYRYDEYSGMGRLVPEYMPEPKNNPAQNVGFEWIQVFGNKLINSITASEDLGIMSGDILKAFGDGGLFKLPQIAENYIVTPVFDPYVFYQIKNATIVGVPSDEENVNNITQDQMGIIHYRPKFMLPSSLVPNITGGREKYLVPSSSRLIVADNASPTPDEVLEITRFVTICEAEYTDDETPRRTGKYYARTCGSEIVTRVYVCQKSPRGSTYQYNWLGQIGDHALYGWSNDTGSESALTRLTVWSRFKYLPQIKLGFIVANQGIRYLGMLQEFDNYTIMDPHEVDKLHTTALLSQFSVPQFGSAIATGSK